MYDDFEDDSCDYVVYLDGDESNDEEGNVITKQDFHEQITFYDFAEIMNTQDALLRKIDALEAELELFRGKSSSGGDK
jgi:hypothetical protein